MEIKKDKIRYKGTEAKTIIFCEGYHLIRNPLFQAIRLNPTKGEVLLIRAEGLSEEYILNKRVFLLPVGNSLFKAGSTYDWQDLSGTPTKPGKESIVERLRQLVSVNYKIVGHQAGIRPAVPNRRPILGFHPVSRNIAIFNGLGTKGVMLAPWFAREMVQLLSSKNYEIAEDVRIERFFK